ncbi:MAG: GEVED domain-containing protein, partial [Flavobacteriales bacterium]
MKALFTTSLFVLFALSYSSAQYCPATGNCNFDVYIDDFTFNTISNLNSAGSNCNTTSYINTGLSTTVTKGNTYTLTAQCGPQYVQGVGIWIDYNQDDDFDDNGEFVWASPYASLITFVDSIVIPQSALTGATRMRVRSKFNAVPTANEACGAFTWGETEDYTVIIQPNTSPPIADFTASTTFTCSGDVDFYDLSTNTPTAWAWDFG